MPPASILASPGPRRLPPRTPGRPPLLPATSTRPKTVRRAVSFSVELKTTQQDPRDTTLSSEQAGHAQLQHALQQQQRHHQSGDRAAAESAAAAALARRPALMRSLSLDVIDTSHIDPIEFARRRDRANSERAGGDVVPHHHVLVPGNGYEDDDEEEDEDDGASDFDGELKKPARTDNAYSAEEIALRRFMTAVAWGPGMPVIKHNRGKGRVRRVLKFNDQEGYLSWCGTLPPYYKTRVAAETLIKATRAGNLVMVQIANQGDVGFQCSRLTDAIVLEVGLNGVIRACGLE